MRLLIRAIVLLLKNGGYVTAASTPKESAFGYVFLDCKLTGEGNGKAFLG